MAQLFNVAFEVVAHSNVGNYKPYSLRFSTQLDHNLWDSFSYEINNHINLGVRVLPFSTIKYVREREAEVVAGLRGHRCTLAPAREWSSMAVTAAGGRQRRRTERGWKQGKECEQSRGAGWLAWFPAERAGGGRRRWSAGGGRRPRWCVLASAGDWLPAVDGWERETGEAWKRRNRIEEDSSELFEQGKWYL